MSLRNQPESSSLLSEPLLLPEEDDAMNENNSPDSIVATPSPQPPLSRNVPIALAYTALVFAGRSVWSLSVLSTFVFLLRDEDYRSVGIITAVMGLAQLITSFPSGYLADRYRRDTLLRVASVVALGAIAATLYAIVQSSYQGLVVVWQCGEVIGAFPIPP